MTNVPRNSKKHCIVKEISGFSMVCTLICQTSAYGIMPSVELGCDMFRRIIGSEASFQLPLRMELFDAVPISYGEAGEICGSQSCCFCHSRTQHFCVEKVALELHEQVVA